MTRIKGFAIRGVLKSVKESGGSIGGLVAALPEADRAVFDRPIVSSDWYPYSAFVGLVRAVDRSQGRGDLAHARELGRQAAGRDLGATFRIISAMTSLKFLLERGQVFWSKYCDQGRMVVDTHEPNTFRGKILGFPDIDEAHCALIEGWLEGIGAALGAEGMKTRQVACVRRGDTACEFEGRWLSTRGRLR
jgi:predicted hydrocarbon binding protein